MDLSIIIPTRNRKESLFRLLDSIKRQNIYPYEIIIVDGSDKKIVDIGIKFKNLKIKYFFTDSRSLTKSRNIGISLVNNNISYVCFLDDDIVFEYNCLEEIFKILGNIKKDIGGIGLNIINAQRSNPLFVKSFKKLFCMETLDDGKVLKSGYNNPNLPAFKCFYSDWLSGGATIWKKSILEEYKFDEWFQGYGYGEDLVKNKANIIFHLCSFIKSEFSEFRRAMKLTPFSCAADESLVASPIKTISFRFKALSFKILLMIFGLDSGEPYISLK